MIPEQVTEDLYRIRASNYGTPLYIKKNSLIRGMIDWNDTSYEFIWTTNIDDAISFSLSDCIDIIVEMYKPFLVTELSCIIVPRHKGDRFLIDMISQKKKEEEEEYRGGV
jgi:hypothetical protein